MARVGYVYSDIEMLGGEIQLLVQPMLRDVVRRGQGLRVVQIEENRRGRVPDLGRRRRVRSLQEGPGVR